MSTFKGYDLNHSIATPNLEISEGIRPAQHFVVAPYLPVQRFDKKEQEWKVISHGKVVSIDSSNYVVPAGYAIDIDTANTLGSAAWTTGNAGSYKNVYTQSDIDEGIKNAAGNTPAVGEPVVKSYFTGTSDTSGLGTQVIKVGFPLGMLAQDAWKQNGAGYGVGYGAATSDAYTFSNFSLQQGVTILTRYFIELPVVSGTSGVVLKGITTFDIAANGAPVVGGMVSFDANSNFVMAPALATNTVAALASSVDNAIGRNLGRIFFVDNQWPKDYLELVKSYAPNTTISGLAINKVPGQSTAGLPDNLWLAGVSDPATAKTVKINVIF